MEQEQNSASSAKKERITVQYGEVAATDDDHPNPYMFAGRRYDIEIGLYYNRSRYYNPYMGRFLQIDPSGYQDSLNLYQYALNNPLLLTDPSGTTVFGGYCKLDSRGWF